MSDEIELPPDGLPPESCTDEFISEWMMRAFGLREPPTPVQIALMRQFMAAFRAHLRSQRHIAKVLRARRLAYPLTQPIKDPEVVEEFFNSPDFEKLLIALGFTIAAARILAEALRKRGLSSRSDGGSAPPTPPPPGGRGPR